MKKIVIITDAWFPQVNGVVTAVAKSSDLLTKKGLSVSIVHPGLFFTLPGLLYPEMRFSFFPFRKLAVFLEKEKPDAIHIETEGPLGLTASFVCLRKKLRFTTAYHTHYAYYVKMWTGLFYKIVYAYQRWFHNKGAATMVSTPSLKVELERHGFINLVVRPLGVDIELFKRSNNLPLAQLARPVFVYFGRIAKEKSVEEFLACNLPGTKLVIGDGPQRKKFERIYRNKALFVGYKKGQDLVNWLSLADVFVFPSRTETFGLTALEALSCGIPVAAHDVMGPRDIITHGVDGYLSENLEQAALACLHLSPEKCRQKALQYSWEASVAVFFRNLIPAYSASESSENTADNFGR